MYCVNHDTVESITQCHTCAKALCAECRHEVKGASYCAGCLEQAIERPRVVPTEPPKTPGLAGVLSGFFPALGPLYNGQYPKAALFAAVFIGLIHAADQAGGEEGFLVLCVMAFWVYGIIDSVKSARLINARAMASPVEATAELLPRDERESLGWGVAILVLGVLFQLHTLDLIRFGTIWKLWPVPVIIFGIMMLRNYFVSEESKQ